MYRTPHILINSLRSNELVNCFSLQPLLRQLKNKSYHFFPSLLNGRRRKIKYLCVNCWRVNTIERLEDHSFLTTHFTHSMQREGCSPMTNSLCWSWWHWGIMRDYDNDTSHTNYHSPLAREWWWGGGVVMTRPIPWGEPDETRWPYDPMNKFWQNIAFLKKKKKIYL